jgi:hypothetical protein
VKDLFVIVEHFQNLKTKAAKEQVQPTDHKKVKEMEKLVRQFIEEFTDRKLDTFVSDLKEFKALVKNDPEIRTLLTRFREFVLKTLKNPKEIQEDAYFEEGNGLVRQITDMVRTHRGTDDKFRNLLVKIFDEGKAILRGIRDDPNSKKFARDCQKLGRDIFFDSTGAPSLGHFRNVAMDIKSLYLPLLQKHGQTIPIPTIEGFTKKADFTIENLVLDPRAIFPDDVRLAVEYDMDFAVKELGADDINALVHFEVRDIAQKVNDVKFKVLVKPNKWRDEGVLTMDISGLSIGLSWRVTYHNKVWRFKVENVTCTIKKLRTSVRSERHRVLDSIGTGLFGGLIKRRIRNAIRQQIMTVGTDLCTKLAAEANRQKN